MPGKIKEAPQLLPGLDLYYEAFLDLCNSRSMGYMSPGSIPFSEVDTWARRYDIEGEEFELLQLFIRRLDGVYINWVNQQSKK